MMQREPFKHLIPGRTYRIAKNFVDYDGISHQPGRRYIFLGRSFLPYDDGLTLYLESGGEKVSIRFQWRNEAQGEIIDHLETYFVET